MTANRMTLTIDLPEEQAAALAAKAKARGVSTEQYVRQVLEQDLAPEWLRQSWESAQQSGVSELSLEEIEAEIAAARKERRERPAQPGA
jgi:plasmid stability protein